jgi:hypothetical protein
MVEHWNIRLLVFPLLALSWLSSAEVQGAMLEYSAECSEITPRAPIVRIRWPRSTGAQAAQIDVSIYKDGFATGRFVSAAITDPAEAPRSGVALRAAQGPLSASKLPEALSLRLESFTAVKDGADIEVVLGGLIPGLNYYLRVGGIGSEIVRVRAPICPVDFVEPQGESPK